MQNNNQFFNFDDAFTPFSSSNLKDNSRVDNKLRPSNDHQQMSIASDWIPSAVHQESSWKSDEELEPPSSKSTRQKFDGITTDEKENLDELFGMYVYSSKDPLKIDESSHLCKLIKTLRPEYKIPSAEELKTTVKYRCKKQFLSSLSVASNLFDDDQVQEILSTLEKKIEKV